MTILNDFLLNPMKYICLNAHYVIIEETDKRYCQSCGMPLRFDVEEYLGTNSDGSRSNEFCYYCLRNGKYIVNIQMSERLFTSTSEFRHLNTEEDTHKKRSMEKPIHTRRFSFLPISISIVVR